MTIEDAKVKACDNKRNCYTVGDVYTPVVYSDEVKVAILAIFGMHITAVISFTASANLHIPNVASRSIDPNKAPKNDKSLCDPGFAFRHGGALFIPTPRVQRHQSNHCNA